MSEGASVDTYVRTEGELGTAHFDFKVAHRGGEPCSSYPKRGQPLPLKIRGTKGVMNNGIRNSTLTHLRLHHRVGLGAEPRHLLLPPMPTFWFRASDIKAVSLPYEWPCQSSSEPPSYPQTSLS
jgi:hypothetical protein